MEIRYSVHLNVRLRMRGIPKRLPRFVYEEALHRFSDEETGLEIAVAQAKLSGKKRVMAVAYRRDADHVLLITIHPIKPQQLRNRMRSGRWRSIQLQNHDY